MKKQKIIGIIMFVAGIILKEVSYIIDNWTIHFIIGVTATIVGSVGLVMATKAMIYLKNQKEKQE